MHLTVFINIQRHSESITCMSSFFRTGARFSVRVSAIEVVGKSENLKDLLVEQGNYFDLVLEVFSTKDPCGTLSLLFSSSMGIERSHKSDLGLCLSPILGEY